MTDWGPPPERGAEMEPERPRQQFTLSLREHIRSVIAEQPALDLRAEIQAVLRDMLAEPETRLKLQGPPGKDGQSVITGGGGGGVTVSGAPINALAAGSNVTITTSGGTATVAASASAATLAQVLAAGNDVAADGTIDGPPILGVPGSLGFSADGSLFISSDVGAIIRVNHDGSSSMSGAAGGSINVQNAGVVEINAGSGVVYINNLPTADPADAGRLWNSSGTLKISAG